MASLGELTAGIAHEIQNPLNFVNNFSEVSNELIDEIQEERRKKKEERDEELVGEILNDIKQNLEKINHHGKRADAIVKGMLQHSRSTNNAVKEPTDINKLADEYLRLAYHGLRAKDKSFNATMKTEFDKSIGNIEKPRTPSHKKRAAPWGGPFFVRRPQRPSSALNPASSSTGTPSFWAFLNFEPAASPAITSMSCSLVS